MEKLNLKKLHNLINKLLANIFSGKTDRRGLLFSCGQKKRNGTNGCRYSAISSKRPVRMNRLRLRVVEAGALLGISYAGLK